MCPDSANGAQQFAVFTAGLLVKTVDPAHQWPAAAPIGGDPQQVQPPEAGADISGVPIADGGESFQARSSRLLQVRPIHSHIIARAQLPPQPRLNPLP